MALKLKFTDEHGIVHINMSPSSGSPRVETTTDEEHKTDISDPKFDTINNRFGQYDLFGAKYDLEIEGEKGDYDVVIEGETQHSLFRSRYNSLEEELANTPYAFATERTLRLNGAEPIVDITIQSRSLTDDISPSKDIEDDRFFNRYDDESLFGPPIDDTPAFTVTQLIHAQDRYYDLSSRSSDSKTQTTQIIKIQSAPNSAKNNLTVENSGSKVVNKEQKLENKKDRTVRIVSAVVKSEKTEAFKVLPLETEKVKAVKPVAATTPVVPAAKRKRESSFAILSETPVASRPSSPRSLPVETRTGRASPFRGHGFRESTSRHNTPRTSAANSTANSPLSRRRTSSLTRIDKMAAAALPPPVPLPLIRPHSPRNFLKENIEEVRELSELNREKHEVEAELKRKEEEEALLKEMAAFEKSKSTSNSRTASRSNSPSRNKLRSRSNSPSNILIYENILKESNEIINKENSLPRPVRQTSRVRTTSKSQPQSKGGSPKHSKLPKRQSSVSPTRTVKRDFVRLRPLENNLNRNQRYMSNSTSSIHETIKIGSRVHDKRVMSKSTQNLNISPTHIKGKPPIFPGRGPPPSNRSINSKRLSPIVGTPNKSPIEDQKTVSAKTTPARSPTTRKPVKTAGNSPATSRLNSRVTSRAASRDPSPEKRNTVTKTQIKTTPKPVQNKTVNKSPSSKLTLKPEISNKFQSKKPISRTSSVKNLSRTPSTKTLLDKPAATLKKKDSKNDLKSMSTSKINEIGTNKANENKSAKAVKEKPVDTPKIKNVSLKNDSSKQQQSKSTGLTDSEEVMTQDSETQYDKITNEKGELVILTKKSIISMTTAAITAQPLEVVTTVTNQLPSVLEKARERGVFERLSSRDLLGPKNEELSESYSKENNKEERNKTDENAITITEDKSKEKETREKDNEKIVEKKDEKLKPIKLDTGPIFTEENVKLKPLKPPYNNPQVERVKQKIDDILKTPEVSTEKILTPPLEVKNTKNIFKSAADKTKKDIQQAKTDNSNKFLGVKDEVVKQAAKIQSDIQTEASKIVDSIITPVEDPKEDNFKVEPKTFEPIVMVVNEKKNGPKADVVEKVTETLVKGDAEVEVQSLNLSTSGGDKVVLNRNKMAAENSASDKSSQSNGGYPQSTSTTPKPPARTKRVSAQAEKLTESKEPTPGPDADIKKNACYRLVDKCKRCCACCAKPQGHYDDDAKMVEEGKKGMFHKLNCCKKKEADEMEREIERAAGKASIQFENETQRKRKLRDIICCCNRKRRVSDVSDIMLRRSVGGVMTSESVVEETGCCGKRNRDLERRDSILSDRPPTSLCNNRLVNWLRGACRRRPEHSPSRRPSMFSKNKSLSPTLPPEDNRPKLDHSLVEHTSHMRGAIPVLPICLAYLCLICNVLVPGFGTILSGMFCLCFGIPRFGVHDGAKHRIGSFVINLVVGCAQLFTVLFCLVGWGWSIWWGVIMLKISRKYRKLKKEAALEEAEGAPPVTNNNHTRA